ncbi:hypothetical protein QQ045_030809 [Rhodiola kirilowii]
MVSHQNIISDQDTEIINKDNHQNIISHQEIPSDQNLKQEINDDHFLSTLEMFITQKWLVKITLLINNDYSKEFTALIDSGADLNDIQEGLIPTRYFDKTTQTLSHAGGNNLQINYKLPEAKVLHDVYDSMTINKNQLLNVLSIKDRLQNQFTLEICRNNPNAFWDKRKHIVSILSKEGFNKDQILKAFDESTKNNSCETDSAYIKMCKEEIVILSHKGLVDPRESSWSGTAFYFRKNSKQDKGISRLIINYEPFIKILKWIRSPIGWINYPVPELKDHGLLISKPEMIIFHTNTNLLGSLNYISASYYLANNAIILYNNEPVQWTDQRAVMIRKIKGKIKALPYSVVSLCYWEKIIEIKITKNGYKGISKQINPETN